MTASGSLGQREAGQRLALILVSAGMLLLIVIMILLFNRFRVVRELSNTLKELAERLEIDNARKTHELEEARRLQLAMLPEAVPQLPHLEIATYMKTATEVGGDYYDFHLGEDDTLTVAVGDATGHGLKAGIMVSVIKCLFTMLAHGSYIPDTFHQMSRTVKGMKLGNLYMALTLLKFNDHTVKISAAGMPPAFLYRALSNTLEEIRIKAMPLGAFPDFPYEERAFELQPGDALILMSDGLPEMHNEDDQILDYPQAQKLVEAVADQSPQTIITHLVESGKRWAQGRPQDDDVTFVVIKVKEKTESG